MRTNGKYPSQGYLRRAWVYMICFGSLLSIIAADATAQDSLKSETKNPTTLQILPRFHYGGYFPFTGALLNHNPVFDVNIFYERKSIGFFAFQAFDLKDRHSYINAFQPGIFATWKIHPTFKARAYFGYIFSQTQGFRDPDSDYYAATSLYWDPLKRLSITHTALFYDYNIQRKLANRLLVSLSYPKFKVDLFLWSRTLMAEKKHAVSTSLAVTVPIVKIGKKASVHFTAAYMRYLTAYRPSYALDDGFVATLAVPVNLLP